MLSVTHIMLVLVLLSLVGAQNKMNKFSKVKNRCKNAANNKQFYITFPWQDFFPWHFPDFIKIPDIAQTSVKIPEISMFSIQVGTLFPSQFWLIHYSHYICITTNKILQLFSSAGSLRLYTVSHNRLTHWRTPCNTNQGTKNRIRRQTVQSCHWLPAV